MLFSQLSELILQLTKLFQLNQVNLQPLIPWHIEHRLHGSELRDRILFLPSACPAATRSRPPPPPPPPSCTRSAPPARGASPPRRTASPCCFTEEEDSGLGSSSSSGRLRHWLPISPHITSLCSAACIPPVLANSRSPRSPSIPFLVKSDSSHG